MVRKAEDNRCHAPDVLVGDRGLCSYVHLAVLAKAGIHGVFRMSDARAMPFPAKRGERTRRGYNRHRRHEPILVELINEDDQVIEIVKPHNRPGHVSPELFASIPGKLVVRAVRYRVHAAGARTRGVTLLTTLTDACPSHAFGSEQSSHSMPPDSLGFRAALHNVQSGR